MAAASSCNFLMRVPFSRNNPNSSSSSGTGSRPSSSLISRHPPNPYPSLHHHPHNPSSPFQFPLLSVSMARPPAPISSSAESTHHPTFVDPSLRHANVLFFKSAYNVQVVVEDNEPEEALLRRFRREVMRAGVIQECKRRRHFENKQEEKKRRVRDAAKRNKRRRSRPRFLSPTDGDTASKKKPVPADDQEDNWEMPEGGLPY
ncbi:30S ribosomal S21, chloroplastic [Cinnamomum micranthum f. kanehirae]|uniref:30S ribosomal S21, chloroplastic n=1 Tax=Cinnamomum micranthum f. kanehirae TaxID=337451 RepID=A0A443MZY9_9MAGN|nr:30S ribosomal S21, chloroplastic [Cinnamomum micranthum f. kanehirae]